MARTPIGPIGTEVSSSNFVERALEGDRQAVAKLISLVEDGSPELGQVMEIVFRHTGRAFTIGITGAPGAGKSSITEGLVSEIRSEQERVGVLAVDPSSPFTGGALLGDRIRMQSHATDEGVFIRSMATRGHLGGLSLATHEAVRILDASGCAFVIIETVGVGQAEIEIAQAADTTIVILTPGWGDSIQAGKAGLLEIGDVFAVNKADRADRNQVKQTVREINQMIDFGPHRAWRPPVIETIAPQRKGLKELWAGVKAHRDSMTREGELDKRRRERIAAEISSIVGERVKAKVVQESGAQLEALVERVTSREIDPYAAAELLLEKVSK